MTHIPLNGNRPDGLLSPHKPRRSPWKHTCRAVYCRRLARKMGAGYIVIPDYPDWLDQIHSLTGRLQGADHVIEASGMSEAAAAFEAALSKKAGKIFLNPQENCPHSGISPNLQALLDANA